MRKQLLHELTHNYLPFWANNSIDEAHGGFYGAVSNDLKVLNKVPRSAILCSRILWTFSIAYRKLGDEQYLKNADWAFKTIQNVFWDAEFGGVYWSVDKDGQPVMDRKHHYAQAFMIYGLSEYYMATKKPAALNKAIDLFFMLESNAYDAAFGGYLEASDREWNLLEDCRLSDRDLNSKKSMNTMLHILEAFTNLRRVWKNDVLEKRHREALTIFLEKIYDAKTGHLKLFFDEQWNSMVPEMSYGHDIEASWLIWEAAEMIGDEALAEKTKAAALHLAKATLQEGFGESGFLYYDGNESGPLKDEPISWWPQYEAMIGFMNAYQLSGEPNYMESAIEVWHIIQEFLTDKENGDIFKQLHPNRTPDHKAYKIGPWEGPYHHVRAMFELLDRLTNLSEKN